MAESEIEVGGKFGLPSIGGFALELEGHYRRGWAARGGALAQVAADQAGLQPGELLQQLTDDEPVRDLFWTALNRAVAVSDPDYISALGRLVGQALDPARVDDMAFMTSELVRLEPLHLRLLVRTFRYADDEQDVDDPMAATAAYPRDRPGSHISSVLELANLLGVNVISAERASARMSADGYVLWVGDARTPGMQTLQPQQWGGDAMALLFPHLRVIHLGGTSYAREVL